MYCSKCGYEAGEADRFCGNCGQALVLKATEFRETIQEVQRPAEPRPFGQPQVSEIPAPTWDPMKEQARVALRERAAVRIAAWFMLLLGAWLGIAGLLGTTSYGYRQDVFYGNFSETRNQVIWLGVISTVLIVSAALIFWKNWHTVIIKKANVGNRPMPESLITRLEPDKGYKGKLRINHVKELLLSLGAPFRIILFLLLPTALYQMYGVLFGGSETLQVFDLAASLALLLLCIGLLLDLPFISNDANLPIFFGIWWAAEFHNFRELDYVNLNDVLALCMITAGTVFPVVIKRASYSGVAGTVLLMTACFSFAAPLVYLGNFYKGLSYVLEYAYFNSEDTFQFLFRRFPVFIQVLALSGLSAAVLFRTWQVYRPSKLSGFKSKVSNMSPKTIVITCTLIGAVLGGVVCRPTDEVLDDQNEAISTLHALAVTFSSDKSEAAANYGEYEVGEAMKAGIGVGGILGGVAGVFFASTRRRSAEATRTEIPSDLDGDVA